MINKPIKEFMKAGELFLLMRLIQHCENYGQLPIEVGADWQTIYSKLIHQCKLTMDAEQAIAPVMAVIEALNKQADAIEALNKQFEIRCCSSAHEPPDTACKLFEAGANGRCVYCDHESKCHPGPGATCEIGSGETGIPLTKSADQVG